VGNEHDSGGREHKLKEKKEVEERREKVKERKGKNERRQ